MAQVAFLPDKRDGLVCGNYEHVDIMKTLQNQNKILVKFLSNEVYIG